MNIYLTMIEDRHADTEAYAFSTPEAAIDYAKAAAHEYNRNPEDFEEETIPGWLYYARYSCEGDCVWVVERELDKRP